MNNKIKELERLLETKVSEERFEEYSNYKSIMGASENDFDKIEQCFDIELPSDFKKFYQYKNGSGYHFHILYPSYDNNCISPFYLLSIDEIIENKTRFSRDELMSEHYSGEEISELDRRIKPYFENKRWIPFAKLAGGSLKLMLDYDPTEHGEMGQIIAYIHDPDFVYYIAKDFRELLNMSNRNLAEWDYIDY